MGSSDSYISRSTMGGVAGRKPLANTSAVKQTYGSVARKVNFRHGKKVVYVTPFRNAAKEEEAKYQKMGKKTEIKKEPDDTGKIVFVVYVYE